MSPLRPTARSACATVFFVILCFARDDLRGDLPANMCSEASLRTEFEKVRKDHVYVDEGVLSFDSRVRACDGGTDMKLCEQQLKTKISKAEAALRECEDSIARANLGVVSAVLAHARPFLVVVIMWWLCGCEDGLHLAMISLDCVQPEAGSRHLRNGFCFVQNSWVRIYLQSMWTACTACFGERNREERLRGFLVKLSVCWTPFGGECRLGGMWRKHPSHFRAIWMLTRCIPPLVCACVLVVVLGYVTPVTAWLHTALAHVLWYVSFPEWVIEWLKEHEPVRLPWAMDSMHNASSLLYGFFLDAWTLSLIHI